MNTQFEYAALQPLSSTEAEIIAASATAVEIVYVRTLLRELGLEQDKPTTLRVDNSGAVELSRDRKSCHSSITPRSALLQYL